MGHRDGTDDGRQSDFNFLGLLTYYLVIENNIQIHFLFYKVTKKKSDVQRQAGKGEQNEAKDMVTEGLENQILSNAEELWRN